MSLAFWLSLFFLYKNTGTIIGYLLYNRVFEPKNHFFIIDSYIQNET